MASAATHAEVIAAITFPLRGELKQHTVNAIADVLHLVRLREPETTAPQLIELLLLLGVAAELEHQLIGRRRLKPGVAMTRGTDEH